MIGTLLEAAQKAKAEQPEFPLSLASIGARVGKDLADGARALAAEGLERYTEMSIRQPAYRIPLGTLVDGLIRDIQGGDCKVDLGKLEFLEHDGCTQYRVTPLSAGREVEGLRFHVVVNHASSLCDIFVKPSDNAADLIRLDINSDDISPSHHSPILLSELPDSDRSLANRLAYLAAVR